MKDDLAPIVAGNSAATSFIDLALVPGDPPRLWVDLITAVVMAPDPRTYRLVQDSPAGRQTLLETADRAEMVRHITQHIAHRLIAREREMTAIAAPTAAAKPAITGYSTGGLILAWLSGFSIGVLALFIAGILISRLSG